ncbi:MAG: hypothetical protein UW68_C0065G0002 [Candidatus Collierbacteria bacterium GW2011_GWB1_44_6]|uniref:Uncharacterized protein n=1 Tax=Candidatus Collierbacteria bacterium GW2011_GWB1_44_6 TaxID=1618384 RepID=A0A0G1JIM6_9BACT|nr:MAG: hypothetical protein UW68_C0065G0002 [Candidatus Collierbacteria bacterium GW2011_GWB1_44_6]
MNYNFKKFEETHGRYESRITVTGSKSIGFPTRFFKDNDIDSYKYVTLFYDEDKMVVGIKFLSDEGEPHKFTIVKSKDGYGGSIIASSFFGKYAIDTKKYKGKYDWKKEITPFGELYVIELKEK